MRTGTTMLCRFTIALALCVSLPLWADDAEVTLDVIHFKPPAGWSTAPDQAGSNAKAYVTGEADAADRAAIVIFSQPKGAGKFDLRANFDAVVKSMIQSRRITEQTEIAASKTRQGYDALTQNLVAQDDKGGTMVLQVVAADVGDRLAGFCYAAAKRESWDKHHGEMGQFLGTVSFGNAPPNAKSASPLDARQGGHLPPAAAAVKTDTDAADMAALFRPRTMSPEQMQAYGKELDARRQPRIAKGTILTEDGKPIANAKISLRVWGTTNAGERANYNLEVDADGKYEQQVPDGLYKVTASAVVTFNGHQTPLPLRALDEKPANQDYASITGIVKDYRVALYGLKPGGDPHNSFDYFDGTLGMNDASTDLFNDLNTRHPKGTRIHVTLTPTGPLIDGSKAKALNYEFNVEQLHLNSVGYGSVPLGTYRATATATTPDGQTKSLQIGTAMNQFGDAATITWQGTGYGNEMLSCPQIYIGG
jgi:hypothetical protein